MTDFDEKHESKCICCGRCCYKKVTFGGKSFFTNVPCKHLDVVSKKCKKYDRRYKIKDGCIPFDQAIEIGSFPSDCPYVVDIKGYIGPLPFSELQNIMEILKQKG